MILSNRLFTSTLTAVAFLASGSIPLAADTLLYNQATDNNGAESSQNDTNAGGFGNFATTYDNFTLSSTDNIDAVTWIGSFFNPPSVGTIANFVVNFYADAAGTPGALLNSTTINGNANQTALGNDNVGDPEFSYSASLSSAFTADSGTQYWLSIVPSMGFPPQWGWENSSGAGDPGDNAAYQVFFGTGGALPTDLAFSLSGNPAAATPEPFSILLLGTVMSLIGIGQLRRRKTN